MRYCNDRKVQFLAVIDARLDRVSSGRPVDNWEAWRDQPDYSQHRHRIEAKTAADPATNARYIPPTVAIVLAADFVSV